MVARVIQAVASGPDLDEQHQVPSARLLTNVAREEPRVVHATLIVWHHIAGHRRRIVEAFDERHLGMGHGLDARIQRRLPAK